MKTVITRQVENTFKRVIKSYNSVLSKVDVVYRKQGYAVYVDGDIVRDKERAVLIISKFRSIERKFEEISKLFDEAISI